MATEIERKFLVRDESWRTHAAPGIFYRQGYLSSAPTCSIRVRVAGDQAHLNIKSATLGVARTEYEYPIPPEDGREMLATLCRGAVIEKTRYLVEHGRHTWEIDVFEGDNSGLVVAEIELRDTDEPFEYPPWLGQEVSDDVRYYNACLVEHPYKEWGSR